MPHQRTNTPQKKPTKRTDRPARKGARSPQPTNTAQPSTSANRPRTQRSAASAHSSARQHTTNAQRPNASARTQQASRKQRAAFPAANARPPRSIHPLVLIALPIVVVALIVFAVVSCVSAPANDSSDPGMPAASDKAAGESTTITLSFAGDCTLGTDENFDRSTSFNAKYDAVDDPSYFFANVADIFAADDATIVNMEGTLTHSTTRADKTFAFKADPEYAQILAKGNVDAASLANNHSHDYGEQSYTDTIEAVEAVGIPTFGYDRIAYLDVKGVKVALIGTYELAEGIGIEDEMVRNINTAKDAGAQIIVVFMHWGTERESVPDSVQMELGHAAIDAGATMVVGSHPHVIQGIEDYDGHPIVYSLGNFCFGGNKNPSDKDCMIFQQTFTVQGDHVTLDDSNVIACSISSSSSSNDYKPTPATGEEQERIEAKIKRSSDAIAALAAPN